MGRHGVVLCSTTDDEGNYFAFVEFEDGSKEFIPENSLISVPALNKGKYGGPSRGGAPGGYMGVSGYRRK